MICEDFSDFGLCDCDTEPKSRAEHLHRFIVFDNTESVGFLEFSLFFGLEGADFNQHIVSQVKINCFSCPFFDKTSLVPESHLSFYLHMESPINLFTHLELFLIFSNIIDF